MKSAVLISGINGFVGRALQKLLNESGYDVKGLTHHKSNTSSSVFYWNIKDQFIDEKAFENIDYIVHLAGAGVANRRWTDKRKKEIIDSRINSSALLAKELEKRNHKIKALVGASAIGYYGAVTGDKIFSENDPPGNDFLSECCVQWEKSYDHLIPFAERRVILRISNVIGNGGMIKKLGPLAEKGMASPLGTGKQFVPWIGVHDLCRMIEYSLRNENINGIYNAVAPEHSTNEDLTKRICGHYGKKMFLPNVPAFMIKLLYGEMSAVILNGSRVSADKILNTGFTFETPALDQALQRIKKY